MIYTNLNNSGEVEAIYAAKRATTTGTPPLSYTSKGDNLEDFLISGNTLQNGTPAPEAPVNVVGCGALEGNVAIVNNQRDTITNYYYADVRISDELPPGTYTISFTINSRTGDAQRSSLGSGDRYSYQVDVDQYLIPDVPADISRTITLNSNTCIWARFLRSGTPATFSYNVSKIAVVNNNESYGRYKIPISSASITLPVYLGQVKTTRRIKKLILTGEENYEYQPQYHRYIFTIYNAFSDGLRKTECFCTHYQCVHNEEAIEIVPDKSIYINQQSSSTQFCIKDEAITSLADFKSYLQQQYTTGTPVTIWYILATPETGIVDEPLHKIGDYADTISLSQSGITVSTIAGVNTITTETTILPSSISVTTPEKEVVEVYAGINYQNPVYYKSRTLTGTVPLSYKALGKPLSDYSIEGNTIQNGVPAPSAPVNAVGVGELTRNLFEIVPQMLNANNWTVSPIHSGNRYFQYFQLPDELKENGTCYCKVHPNYSQGYTPDLLVIGLIPDVLETVDTEYRILTNQGIFYDRIFDFSNWNHVYLCIGYGLGYNTGGQADIQKQQMKIDEFFTNYNMTIALNSFMSSYEPYGYKLPITCDVTKNIYLGQVPTTRMVKKLELTGEEDWYVSLQGTYYITVSNYYHMYDIGCRLSICSHFPNKQNWTPPPEMHYCLGGLVDGAEYTTWNGNIVFSPSPMISSLTDWKSYLATQYAQGTPVTVWYVLAESETAVVNEPLHKIGSHGDTISMAQASVIVPTVVGVNTLTVDTVVHPSEMNITGNIKPVGYGQLLDVNDVDIQDKNNVPIFIHS